MLRTALLGLASIVLLLVLGLGSLVASDASDSAAECARHTVSYAGAKVVELTLGLLLLAFEVLLTARLLQILRKTC